MAAPVQSTCYLNVIETTPYNSVTSLNQFPQHRRRIASSRKKKTQLELLLRCVQFPFQFRYLQPQGSPFLLQAGLFQATTVLRMCMDQIIFKYGSLSSFSAIR